LLVRKHRPQVRRILGRASAAIKRAAEVFDIPPERQDRISVRNIGKGEKS
jgi:hypothetical protein